MGGEYTEWRWSYNDCAKWQKFKFGLRQDILGRINLDGIYKLMNGLQPNYDSLKSHSEHFHFSL